MVSSLCAIPPSNPNSTPVNSPLTHTDIYIACVSSAHNVCPKGYWIAIVSTIAETSANHHLELAPGIERLGRIEEQFMVSPASSIYRPNDN